MCTHNVCFEEIIKTIKYISIEIFHFYSLKFQCILHGYVFSNVEVENKTSELQEVLSLIPVNWIILRKIRAVAGQRSSPDLCFATTSVKIYDP